jgi:Ser/Thr protein kinase RdoA (MazF antagonist)
MRPSEGVPWCDLRRRLTLLTPETARIAEAYGAHVAQDITEGWLLFELHATARATRIVNGLFADPSPLLRALDPLPRAFLHGDLKLDNIGLDTERRMWLIDWAMTLVAPPAIELGWFLAINSRRLPVTLDDVMGRYARAAAIPPVHRRRHEALTVLCGLLLRGWRKALDAEAGEPNELRWWCDRAEEAERFL